MVKMFITKSKINENLKTTVELTGNRQENQAELSQSSWWFIFRISVEHMGNYHQVYMAPICNFTQNYYLNPERSFSPRVGSVQLCCSWEWSWCDTENIFLSLCRAECERNAFDASSLQANRRVVWQTWAESSEQPTVNH